VGASIFPSTLFVVGDMQALPFADESFDVVFSSSVLQLADWRRVIRECRRILKKDGRAVFIENLRGNPFARGYRLARRIARYRYPETEIPVAHIEWGERKEFEEVFSEAEFDVFHVVTPMLLVTPALNHLLRGKAIQMSGQRVYRFLHRIDDWLLRRFPVIANWGWMLVVKATK
jgi:SAM-dependent methyltransferase